MASIQKRKHQNGGTTYRAQVRVKGYPLQSKTFPNKTLAERWAKQTEQDIVQGRHIKIAEAQKHTLAEAIERYIDSVIPLKPRSAEGQLPQLRWWKENLGQYNLSQVTPSLISEKRDQLRTTTSKTGRTYSHSSVNRFLAVLSHLFTTAKSEWGWVEENPVQSVKKLQEPQGRTRYLSDEERGLLLKTCIQSQSQFIYPVVLIALSTGARKSEILNLEWTDIDFQDRRAIFKHTKHNEQRRVALIDPVISQLRKLKEKAGPTVFVFENVKTQKPLDIRRAWETAIKAAGLEDFRFHDLRHSAASYLAMNGASLLDISAILGHRTLEMVKRYSHLSDQHLADQVHSLGTKIFGDDQNDT